ncbi:MAG: tetratricopeptide repeat protein [Polyangiaceae bacterium]
MAGLYVAAGVLSGQLSLADDYAYIVQYGHYDRPLDLAGLAQMFSGISKQEMLHDYYRPLYTLVRSIDYRLHGVAPAGYHVTSLLFYLLAVASAYWILRRLLSRPWVALGGALLFAFHPIHVEPVAWIMAGGYTIAGGLALLSFALYMSRKTWASTLTFAAAALTNPPAIVVPALALGHMMVLPSGETQEQRRRYANVGWMSAVAAVVAYLNFVVFPQRYARAFFDTSVAARSWLANFLTTVRFLVIPLGLRTPYEGYVDSPSDPRWIAGLILLLLAAAALGWMRTRHRLAAFGVLWFLSAIVPTVTVWKNATGMADRYVFLASFGLVVAAAGLLSPVTDGGLWTPRLQARAPMVPWVLCTLFLSLFAAVTWHRVRLWHDTEALFTDTLRQEPRNIFAARTLGRYYSITLSSPDKGVPLLERTIALTEVRIARLTNASLLDFERYNLSELRNELGIAQRESGHYERAIALHEEAILGIPDTGREAYRTAEYYFQMGLAYDKLADTKLSPRDQIAFRAAQEKALECYRMSIDRLPLLVQAHQNAALALFRLGRPSEAEALLDTALTLTPNNVEAEGLLARIYVQTGEREKAATLLTAAIEQAGRRKGNGPLLEELRRVQSEAIGKAPPSEAPSSDQDAAFIAALRERKYEEALDVALSQAKARDTPDPSLLNNIGLCYYKLARYPEAEHSFLEAIKLRPDYGTAMDNLSLVYAKQDRLDLAISYAEKALQLQPGDPGIARHLDAYRRKQLAGTGPGGGP